MAVSKRRSSRTISRRPAVARQTASVSRQTAGKRPASLTPGDERLKDKWDALIEPIIAEWRHRPATGAAPYDQKANYLRREVYRVVGNLLERSEGKQMIEAAVLGYCGREPTRLTMSQNPFFWGLKAVADRISLAPDRVSRLAKEMNYAWRHNIKPDLLVGFILQTGASRIYKSTEIQVEKWFSEQPRSPE
jgi:hypothetical protein